MKYDPIKKTLGNIFNQSTFLRIIFYKLLDLLLLRTWHVKKHTRQLLNGKKAARLSCLDAGMGFGQYSYWLSSVYKNATVLGVDLKEDQVASCNTFFKKANRPACEFAYADLTQINYTEQFDFVLNVDVLEHIEEDELVMRNFYNSLKRGGMLLISTPSDLGGSDAHDDHDESFIGEHVRVGYSISDITEKLQRAGFVQIKTSYSYGFFGQISWMLSMKYPILALNASKCFAPLVLLYYILVFPLCIALNTIDLICSNSKGTGLIVSAKK